MSAEEDKAVVRRLFEALNSRDDAVVDELVAPDCQIIHRYRAGTERLQARLRHS